jgi:hypothetical protein
MNEFLKRWRLLIVEGGEEAEQRLTYEDTVRAFRRSDWAEAADLIEYARKNGWKLPEVEP